MLVSLCSIGEISWILPIWGVHVRTLLFLSKRSSRSGNVRRGNPYSKANIHNIGGIKEERRLTHINIVDSCILISMKHKTSYVVLENK